MTTHSETGSFDLSTLNNLNQNLTQYFWFEEGGSGSYPWGLGAHVTLYPQSDFTDPNDSNYLKGQNILINTDGFSLRNGIIPLVALDNDSLDFNLITDLSQGTYVTTATFGLNGSQIGQDGNVRMIINNDSFSMVDRDGATEFAHIGAPIGAQITDTFTYSGSSTFTLSQTPSGDITVSIDGTATSSFSVSGTTLTITTSLADFAVVTAQYGTTDEVKYYTMGKRAGNVGAWSMAEGYLTQANGLYSHAEGYLAKANGQSSHAEGTSKAIGRISHAEGAATEAAGDYSHAEGYWTTAYYRASHAEGEDTLANGHGAHAEGFGSVASGDYSHAQNFQTAVASRAQTVIGEYNIVDVQAESRAERGAYAFIIGNGTASNARSNALTVDWNGKVKFGTPSNNKIAAAGLSNNATSFDIGWDWANRDGALLALRSVDYTTGNEGAFSLIARNGTDSSALTGYAGGGLNWGGTPISLQGHTHTNPISVPAQQSVSFKATAANTWQYTGLSFTIPSGHQRLVRPWVGWNSGKPTGVGFETSTSMGTKGFPTYNFENANGFYTPPVFLLPAGTFYLFEKRATVPTAANTDYVSFVDLVCYGSIT